MTVPLVHVLAVSTILFSIGVGGLLARRSLLFMLAAVEVMFVAAGIAFVGVSSSLGDLDGQIVYFFLLAAAAAQVSVGLALVLAIHQRTHTIDADRANSMRG